MPAVLEMDLGDIKSIPAKARVALAIFGEVDILVNNAGILHSGNVLDTELDVDRKVMDVNYFGTLALTKGPWEAVIQIFGIISYILTSFQLWVTP